MTNHILRHCRANGSYTLSVGTMEPAVVLKRLLEALVTLDSEAHRRLTGPGSLYSAIPPHALRAELDRWWASEEAIGVVEQVLRAIDAATVPDGFASNFADADRFELIKVSDEQQPAPPGIEPTASTSCPPSINAWRDRVQKG